MKPNSRILPLAAGLYLSCAPAQAALTAYDGFYYAPAGSNLLGQTGGTGWSGAWRTGNYGSDRLYNLAAGSLSFPNLASDGNSIACTVSNAATLYRGFATSLGANGTTRYLSFLVRPDGPSGSGSWLGLGFDGSTSLPLFVGKPGNNETNYVVETGSGLPGVQAASSVTAVPGQTALLVLKCEFRSGADRFTLYVNPVPGEPEPTNGVVKSDLDLGTVYGLSWASQALGTLDELRMGDTFADVTPLAGIDVVWTNTAGGNWSVATNWSPNRVPLPFDSVWITNTSNYTVTLDTNATIAGLRLGGDDGTQTLSQSASTLALSGTGSSSAHGVYALGGTGTLTGSGTLALDGPFNWTGGTNGAPGSSLTVIANGGMNLSGGAKYLRGGTLINGGVGSWTAGTITLRDGAAIFSNAPSGELNLQASGTAFSRASGSGTLCNGGMLRINPGTGTNTIQAPFNNSGSLEVQNGTFALTGGGTNCSQFTCAAGATLNFGSGTHWLQNGSSLTGPGGVLASGTVNVDGAFTATTVTNAGTLTFRSGATACVTNLYLKGGTLTGDGTVVVPGVFTWTGGSLGSANAGLQLKAQGGLSLNNASKTFNGGTLINGALCAWSGGQINCYNNANFRIAPGGTLELRTNGVVFNATSAIGPSLINEGTLRKTGGSGQATSDLVCVNSGLIELSTGSLSLPSLVQNGGQTVLDGGQLTFTLSQSAELLGGVLSGSGTVTGSLYNDAAIRPGGSPGRLTITGGYTEGPNARLEIELGGTNAVTGYDQLSIGGSASLAGTLDLSFVNGFTPAPGDRFTVLVCGTRNGIFSAVSSPVNNLSPGYASTQVVVESGNSPPVVVLDVDPAQTVCRTFLLRVVGNDPDGTVTNLWLFLGSSLLLSVATNQTQVTVSWDFPGDVTFTAQAADNKGAMPLTNVTVHVATLPPRVLDAVGFQTNGAFKLCLADAQATN
jgi:hypothetical protein